MLGCQLASPHDVQAANEEFGEAVWLQAIVLHRLSLVKSLHHVQPFSSKGAPLLFPSTSEHVSLLVRKDDFVGVDAILFVNPVKTELKIEMVLPVAADQQEGPPSVRAGWAEQQQTWLGIPYVWSCKWEVNLKLVNIFNVVRPIAVHNVVLGVIWDVHWRLKLEKIMYFLRLWCSLHYIQ